MSLLLLALVFLSAHPARAAENELRRVTLDNGLRVVLQRDLQAPHAVVAVSYLAGSAYDPPRRAGLARLLEAAMFMGGPQGSRLGPGDHRRMLEAVGGSAAVERSADVTSYVNRVPAARVPLALWLEAQRMLAIGCKPALLAAERKRQLAAYRERQRRDAAGMARERLRLMALQAHPAYGKPALGDIETLGCDDVVAAHQAQHGPARGVVTVIGSFDPDELIGQLKSYFAPIERRSSRPGWRSTMREQTTRRAASFRSQGGHRNVLAHGWAVSGTRDSDRAALEVMAALLGGAGSRIHRKLVIDDAKALSVTASLEGLRGPDVLSVVVELPRDQLPADVAQRVEEAAQRLINLGPSEDEVRGAREQLATRLLRELQSRSRRAHRLGEHELLAGDASALLQRNKAYGSVTREAVRRVARRHLLPHRSATIEGFAAAIPRPPGSDDGKKGKKKRKKRRKKKARKPKRKSRKAHKPKRKKSKRKAKPKPKPKRKKSKRKAKPKPKPKGKSKR